MTYYNMCQKSYFAVVITYIFTKPDLKERYRNIHVSSHRKVGQLLYLVSLIRKRQKQKQIRDNKIE